jgi:hypothetical protein
MTTGIWVAVRVVGWVWRLADDGRSRFEAWVGGLDPAAGAKVDDNGTCQTIVGFTTEAGATECLSDLRRDSEQGGHSAQPRC